jgi:carboxyl-terminal processing protease
MEQLLQKSLSMPCRGIIFDVRFNSGGLLNSVIDICGLFLKKGSVVVTVKDKTGTVVETYYTERDPVTTQPFPPIVVLINNYTASAAEILAGCLKIHAQNKDNNLTVFTLGEQSFGKGSVQEVIPLPNNCALKLTTTLYFLPDDSTIQGVGITPDFLIERTLPQTEQMKWLTKQYGRESALPNYISIQEKKDQEEKEKSSTTESGSRNAERIKSILQGDNQFAEALAVLNSIALFTPQTTSSPLSYTQLLQGIFPAPELLHVEEIGA